MAKPSWDKIRARVRKVIADDKGYDPLEIHDNDKLIADLRYNNTSLGALTPDINDEFFVSGKGISVRELCSCLKVIGIAARVRDQPIADFK